MSTEWCSKTTDGAHAFDGPRDPDCCAACGERRAPTVQPVTVEQCMAVDDSVLREYARSLWERLVKDDPSLLVSTCRCCVARRELVQRVLLADAVRVKRAKHIV